MGRDEKFSIRQMVELTGLSEFTIRGWENRYLAFNPKRGDSGRREYSKSDVERALLLRELLKRGHKIGKIAKLNNLRLKSLFEQSDGGGRERLNENRSEAVSKALDLVALQKWSELDLFIREFRAEKVIDLIHDFFLPMLQALAANVNAGLVSISQEHIFSSFLKEKIYSTLSPMGSGRSGGAAGKIRFVLVAPEGDYHEMGLLLAHLLIRSHGFTSLYLGPHTPARDLSETALRFDASHLLIVSTVSKKDGARQGILSYVSDVQKAVGSHPRILVAGAQARVGHQPSSSLSILTEFSELENFLGDLAAENGRSTRRTR